MPEFGEKEICTRNTGGRYPTHVGARACNQLQPHVARELEKRGTAPAAYVRECMACNSLTTRITRLHGHVLTVCKGKCGSPATQTCRGRSHTAGIHENNGTTTCRENYGYRDPATIGTRACSATASQVKIYTCTTQGQAYEWHVDENYGKRDRLTSAASLHMAAAVGIRAQHESQEKTRA
jgi:hypothetical protein